jgi:catechol 2,3-dioxygenase-like lactoylglutathione lyase family enzyme
MTIQLDHVMVHSRNPRESARQLASLLGVPYAETTRAGPFSPVYVNDGLTLDFVESDAPFPIEHCCFRVDDDAFDAILGRIRAAGIAYRSTPHGAIDHRVNTDHGGRIVFWSEPDGHYWEILTVSYARADA